MNIIDIILHLDQYLALWVSLYGTWIYVLLFLIIFAETGLVITPFLPGDSLLFAVGALTTLTASADISIGTGTGTGAGLDYFSISVLLVIAAFCGDNVNYQVGKWLGPRLFFSNESRFLKKKHLDRTHQFYERHGTKAIIIARFAPLLRTFVPFVAGLGRMNFPKYLIVSFIGAILWTQIFLCAGRWFGNMPQVKTHFHLVIIGVIIISLIPAVLGWYQQRKFIDTKR